MTFSITPCDVCRWLMVYNHLDRAFHMAATAVAGGLVKVMSCFVVPESYM